MAVEELLAKQMPYSIEAEQAVLGSMLIDPQKVPDVVELLKTEDFYMESNRILYEAINRMFLESRSVDPVTVLDEVKAMGYREKLPRDYVLQLVELTPHSANALDYARIVRSKSLLRELQQLQYEEIARVLQLDLGTVKSRLYRARNQLREILTARGTFWGEAPSKKAKSRM